MTDIRKQRLEKRILILVSDFYFKKLKDYDTGVTTFVRCDLSQDASHAKIYISLYSVDTIISPSLDLLKRYAYDIRSSIAKNIKMQNIPRIDFFLDDSLQKNYHLNTLLS